MVATKGKKEIDDKDTSNAPLQKASLVGKKLNFSKSPINMLTLPKMERKYEGKTLITFGKFRMNMPAEHLENFTK